MALILESINEYRWYLLFAPFVLIIALLFIPSGRYSKDVILSHIRMDDAFVGKEHKFSVRFSIKNSNTKVPLMAYYEIYIRKMTGLGRRSGLSHYVIGNRKGSVKLKPGELENPEADFFIDHEYPPAGIVSNPYAVDVFLTKVVEFKE